MNYDGPERRDNRRRQVHECSNDTCQYHVLTEAIIKQLQKSVDKLTEGQEQMKETVIHLTEVYTTLDRIDKKIEKLEDRKIDRHKEMDRKVQQLEGFMYKSIGSITAMVTVATVFLKYFGVG